LENRERIRDIECGAWQLSCFLFSGSKLNGGSSIIREENLNFYYANYRRSIMMNIYEQVERNINELVDNNVDWSACATSEEMQNAKEGKLTIKEHGKKLDIHHIKEIKEYPELTYVESNLFTVCVHHHNILDNKNQFNIERRNKNKFINEERW